jgi:probable F420-dependent oxidoreductase
VTPKLFRFGVAATLVESRREIQETARRAEGLGFSTLLMTDHLGFMSPFPPLVVAAGVTTTLRVGTLVLNNGFQNPVLLAREAATVDLMTDGRLELGFGTGYKQSEHAAAGIPYHGGAERFERLAASVQIVKALLEGRSVSSDTPYAVELEQLSPLPVQTPRPPILVAGQGPRVLRMAAREADVIGLIAAVYDQNVQTHEWKSDMTALGREGALRGSGWAPDALDAQVEIVRQAAHERPEPPELQAILWDVAATDSPADAAAAFAATGYVDVSPEVATATPFLLYGSIASMAEQLQERRERFGISYYSVSAKFVDVLAPVVELLAGT